MPADLALAPGQVCTYRGAIVPTSRAIIGRVDSEPGGSTIISITLTDVPLPDPATGTLVPKEASHLPMDGAALRASLVECAGTAPVTAAFWEGYAIWREAYDAGRAGVFTLPLREVQTALAKILAPKRSP